MNKSKLASVIGIAVAVGAVVYLWSGERGGEAAEAQAEHVSAEPEVTPQFEDEFRRDAHPSETREVAAKEAEQKSAQRIDTEPWAPPTFEYELEVRVFDEADQPGLKEPIFLAPAGHTLNEVGNADLDGRLLLKWFGFEPRMQVDLALRGGEGLRRIDVAAGFTSVALPKRGGFVRATATRSVVNLKLDATRLDGSKLLGRGTEVEPPQARRDAEGRVQFVEPFLYAGSDTAIVLRPRDEGSSGGYASSLDKGAIGVRKTSAGDDPAKGQLAGRLLDSSGAPVAGAPLVANLVGGGPRPSALTLEDGSFRFRNLQPGEWDLRAGGGDFGRASARLVVSAGRTTEWEVELDRGLELKGRLLDAKRTPLAGWRLLAETLGDRDALVDVAVTDAEGRFAIPNLPTLPLRLLARREVATAGSEVLVADQLWPGENEREFTLDVRNELAPGALQLRVTFLEGSPSGASTALAWRVDTGRAVPGTVHSDRQGPSPFGELSPLERGVQFKGLEPGWYDLTINAVGREPLTVARVFAADQQVTDLPTLHALLPARLAVGGHDAPEALPVGLELTWRGSTVELHSTATDLPGTTGFLRPGDYRIVRTIGTTTREFRLRAETDALSELD